MARLLVAALTYRLATRALLYCSEQEIFSPLDRMRLSALIFSKFHFLYLTFLHHVVKLLPSTFSSPATVPSKFSPYNSLQP
jgi:hypothetical protein